MREPGFGEAAPQAAGAVPSGVSPYRPSRADIRRVPYFPRSRLTSSKVGAFSNSGNRCPLAAFLIAAIATARGFVVSRLPRREG